jgi:hypothetical protein
MGRKSSTFEKNYALLMEKFPQLALEIPGVESRGKKESLKPFSLKNAEVFYFYGVGLGEAYKMAEKWLRESPLRRLVFLEDDLEKISAFLHSRAAETILKDSQVVLGKPSDVEDLTERFPSARVAVAALPSKEGSEKLKEEILRKAAFSSAVYTDRLNGFQPFQNFVRNLRHLPASFYANKLSGKFRGIPAIVCGAGPSLQKAIPLLRTLENKALIIAGGSTLAALSSQGITPHFGMAVDPNLEEYRRLKNSFAFEVPLLYSTRVFPAIFQTSSGPFGYMRSGIGGFPELWMEEELGLFDKLIGTGLTSDALSVTSICLAWAEVLGCNPILLSGVDLAYTDGKRYAEGVTDESVDLEEECGAADKIVKGKDRMGKPVYTAIRWLMESSAFSDFASLHPETTFWNTTEGGIGFQKIPFRPLDEAIRPLPDLGFSLRGKVHEEIAAAPMPANTGEMIRQKMGELALSLDRIVEHLEVLAKIKPGSAPLAEVELLEEMAYPYLFYDALSVLEKGKDDPSQKWSRFLHLARQYQHVLL